MKENSPKGSSVDFQMAFLVLAVVGGAYLLPSALRSARPGKKESLERTSIGDQVVPARLWQDPFFEVALDYRKKNYDKIYPTNRVGPANSSRKLDDFYALGEIGAQIKRHWGQLANHVPERQVTIMEVFLSGGSYAEDAEDRHRKRYAVLSALGVAGYVPWDAEHLGYAETPWPRGQELERMSKKGIPPLSAMKSPAESTLVVPYDWFVRNALRSAQATSDVLVLWLNADAFEDHPAKRLAQFNQELRLDAREATGKKRETAGPEPVKPDNPQKPKTETTAREPMAVVHKNIDFKLIDPSLRAMLDEYFGPEGESATNATQIAGELGGIEIYSSWSTTADAVLTTNATEERRSAVISELDKIGWGTNFWNATCTDDELAEELVDELALRGTDVTDTSHGIVLISEWDTPYGRALPLTFAAVVKYRTNDIFAANSFTNLPVVRALLGAKPKEQTYINLRNRLSQATRDNLDRGNPSAGDDSALRTNLARDFNKVLQQGTRAAESLTIFSTNPTTSRATGRLFAQRANLSAGKRVHLNRRLLEEAFPGAIVPNRLVDAVEELKTSAAAWPSNIFRFTYLRGVDGRVPGDSQGGADTDKATGKESSPDGLARPEGHSQLDYLPRLTAKLALKEKSLKKKGFELKAIGILGSDVYDKLLVLQALRRDFSDELFFTTDLDARLTHPDALKWSRNLILASSFGLQAHDEFQRDITPFRDTYQTGQYLACLAALGVPGVLSNLDALTPRRYEIGRKGAYDLSLDDTSRIHPEIPQADLGKIRKLTLNLIFLGVLLTASLRYLLGWELPDSVKQGTVVAVLRRLWKLILVGSLLLIAWFVILALWRLARELPPHLINRQGVPLDLTQGISLWSTEALRLIAVTLALCFMFRAHFSLKANKAELKKHYAFPLAEDPRSNPAGEKELVCVEYDQGGYWANRWRRLWRPVANYYLLAIMLFAAFGLNQPFVPFRGNWSHAVDDAVILVSGLLQVVLIFFVVDASRGCARFIEQLTDADAAWPPEVCRRFHDKTGVECAYLNEYIDVTLIAKRTEVVGKLIFYPFAIIFLMIVSRSNFLGRWDWPTSMIIILGLNAIFAVYAVLALRRAAEKARQAALQKMNENLLKVLGEKGDSPLAQQLPLLIQKIESLEEGVFAPVSRQPVIKALLMPFGGAGVVGLLNYLATKM